MNIMWKKIAHALDKEGAHVNWMERFFVCPCCDEIVDEDDWTEGDYEAGVCPVCGQELLY